MLFIRPQTHKGKRPCCPYNHTKHTKATRFVATSANSWLRWKGYNIRNCGRATLAKLRKPLGVIIRCVSFEMMWTRPEPNKRTRTLLSSLLSS